MATNEETCTATSFAEPLPEHRWLQQFVGDWTFETEAIMEPGQPPVHFRGRERVRSLGGLWIVGEGEGEMPGGGVMTTRLTLGYDPQKERFVGTWIGSVMTHLWLYDGALDSAGKILTLDSEGPDMAGSGALTMYQDIYTVKSADRRILTSRMRRPDGSWYNFMTATYERQA